MTSTRSTAYDDPNRESVGLAPIWTGAGEPPPEPEVERAAAKRGAKAKDEQPEVDDGAG